MSIRRQTRYYLCLRCSRFGMLTMYDIIAMHCTCPSCGCRSLFFVPIDEDWPEILAPVAGNKIVGRLFHEVIQAEEITP